MGVWGYYGDSKGDMGKEGTATWDNTYQLKLHMPPIFLWYAYGEFGPCRSCMGSKAALFELE